MRSLFRGLVALLLLVCVACSDGDTSAADKKKPTTTTTIATLGAEEVDAEASPYCAVWADIREVGGPPVSGDTKKDVQVRKDHYAKLVPLAERLVEAADDEIKAQAEAALEQVREVAETGSDEPFLAEGAVEMQQELAAYAQEHCAKG